MKKINEYNSPADSSEVIEVTDSLSDGTPVTLKFPNADAYQKFLELGEKMRDIAKELYPSLFHENT